MLGLQRWKEIIRGVQNPQGTLMPIEGLMTEVKAFIGEAEQVDDITLLTIRKMLPPKAAPTSEVSAAASCFPQNFVLNSDAFNSKFFTK